MTVSLQFSRQASLSSDLIAYEGAGEFSHVDAVMPSGELLGSRSDEVGGKPAGVQIRPANYAVFVRRAIFTLPTVAEREVRFWAFLHVQIGKPYDKAAIYGFITGRNWRDEGSWFCSELQGSALEISSMCPPLYLATNRLSPSTLACVVSALGAARVDNP